MTHRGQIVANIIRKRGHPLTRLANKLGISRNTLYSNLENPTSAYSFMIKVGTVLHHDFTKEFPTPFNRYTLDTPCCIEAKK